MHSYLHDDRKKKERTHLNSVQGRQISVKATVRKCEATGCHVPLGINSARQTGHQSVWTQIIQGAYTAW